MTFNSFPIPTKPGFEALLLQKSGEVAGYAARAEDWAESATAPGDPGTKSAKTHAGEAAASALAAFNSEGSAQGSLESLYARYLGAHSTAPVVDGNGDPLAVGALYWDIPAEAMYAWTGSSWSVTYNPSTGSVTSVGVSMPTGFTVSGSPITSAGAIGVSYTSGYQGYTSSEASKLSGIESGAQVNVQSDWNAGSGDAYIMNKPVLGSMAVEDAADYVPKAGSSGLGGFTAAGHNLGALSGTVTPSVANGNFQYGTKGGNFTLAAPADGYYSLQIGVTNTSASGSLTATGFNKVNGDFRSELDAQHFLLINVSGTTKVLTIMEAS